MRRLVRKAHRALGSSTFAGLLFVESDRLQQPLRDRYEPRSAVVTTDAGTRSLARGMHLRIQNVIYLASAFFRRL